MQLNKELMIAQKITPETEEELIALYVELDCILQSPEEYARDCVVRRIEELELEAQKLWASLKTGRSTGIGRWRKGVLVQFLIILI